MTVARVRTSDRRVGRTRRFLREALLALIREKPYDAIAVKEILARADVGRSTFYAHFRDKDALLASGIREMLRSHPSAAAAPGVASPDRVLWFSRPVFESIDEHRRTRDVHIGLRSHAPIHRQLGRVLTELVTEELRRQLEARRRVMDAQRRALVVQHVVSSFFVVLSWWVGANGALSPAEADDAYRALVLPSVAAALE